MQYGIYKKEEQARANLKRGKKMKDKTKEKIRIKTILLILLMFLLIALFIIMTSPIQDSVFGFDYYNNLSNCYNIQHALGIC